MSNKYLSSAFLSRNQSASSTIENMIGEEGDNYTGESQVKSTTPCAACNKVIESNSAVKALGKHYHQNCFCCISCNKRISTSKFSMNEHGQFKCENCAVAEIKQGGDAKGKPVCTKCKKPIQQSGVKMGSSIFHKECYVCGACFQPFKTRKIAIDRKTQLPVCEDCIKNKKTPQTSPPPEKSSNQASTTTKLGLDDLAKLAELKDKGILTEEEFQQKKKQILGI